MNVRISGSHDFQEDIFCFSLLGNIVQSKFLLIWCHIENLFNVLLIHPIYSFDGLTPLKIWKFIDFFERLNQVMWKI